MPPPTLIGLGLQEQLVDHVPVGEHDFPLDMVCLPDTLLTAKLKPTDGSTAAGE